MRVEWMRGCATALVTPFAAGGAVDEGRMRALIERQIEGGVRLLVPCGTTGESVTMSEEEDQSVIRATVEAARGRVRVVAGTGSNATSSAIDYSRAARDLGADAVLVVAPYYNKPTQEGLYAHFRAVAEAVPALPVVLYNVPGRTSCNVSGQTVLRLARDVENVVAVKEASGNFSQIMEILRGRPEGFRVLSGDDALTLALVALGADGLISVASNEVPELMSRMVEMALAGEWGGARELHYRLLPLMEANFIETSPGPCKAAMAAMGLLEENFRLPLVPVGEKTRARMREVLGELGVLREGRMSLRERIEELAGRDGTEFSGADRELFAEFKAALNRGEVRAAERTGGGEWRVNSWVKRGVLLGFRMGALSDMSAHASLRFFDKDTYPVRATTLSDNVRIVPGGSSVRDGAYLAPGVVCMPPMYVNVGAYVDEGTMIDSHALVGSCAQIGRRVHLSAAAQIGGVIEPVGAMPVIVEDDVLVGGNTGIYEGAVIKQRAVVAAGTILTGSTPVYDLVNG
ncbi:MAG: 4-hydroxy-tetrahydrodipicolinate synthase, partial [Pyrinomonadaceae bacterium]